MRYIPTWVWYNISYQQNFYPRKSAHEQNSENTMKTTISVSTTNNVPVVCPFEEELSLWTLSFCWSTTCSASLQMKFQRQLHPGKLHHHYIIMMSLLGHTPTAFSCSSSSILQSTRDWSVLSNSCSDNCVHWWRLEYECWLVELKERRIAIWNVVTQTV